MHLCSKSSPSYSSITGLEELEQILCLRWQSPAGSGAELLVRRWAKFAILRIQMEEQLPPDLLGLVPSLVRFRHILTMAVTCRIGYFTVPRYHGVCWQWTHRLTTIIRVFQVPCQSTVVVVQRYQTRASARWSARWRRLPSCCSSSPGCLLGVDSASSVSTASSSVWMDRCKSLPRPLDRQPHQDTALPASSTAQPTGFLSPPRYCVLWSKLSITLIISRWNNTMNH